MRVMILAAGRGERMGELTKRCPKPLLRVGNRALIEYALYQCKVAGFTEVVINVSYHADQIMDTLGDGSRFGLSITYSIEPERLETGGGIVKALPLLGDQPFIVLSGDVITGVPLAKLPRTLNSLAHLVLVPNPDFHPQGDFGLHEGFLTRHTQPTYTFGNVGVYHPDLFAGCEVRPFPLNQLLFPAIEKQQITGEIYQGPWYNVGNPVQLADINRHAGTSLLAPVR